MRVQRSTHDRVVERLSAVTVDGQAISLEKVQSSNVAGAGYDASRRLLVCQFLSGAAYVYRNIPETKWADFRGARSKGKYLQQHVVGHHAHPFERLDV